MKIDRKIAWYCLSVIRENDLIGARNSLKLIYEDFNVTRVCIGSSSGDGI